MVHIQIVSIIAEIGSILFAGLFCIGILVIVRGRCLRLGYGSVIGRRGGSLGTEMGRS